MRKLTTDRRPDLCHLLGRAEPVEPRHQGRMQARGDRQRRGGNRGRSLHRFQLAPGLQHRLCHLFYEQWDAVGALDDVLSDVRRQQLVADDAVDHGCRCRAAASRLIVSAVTCGCPTQGGSNSGRNVTINSTRRVAIRSTVRPNASRLVGSPQCASSKIISTGLERARVSNCDAECLQRFLPALFGSKLQSGVASVVGKRQHLGEQRRVLPGRRGLRQQRIELVELCLRCVAVRKSGGTFELPDDRIKGAVGVLGRAEITQPRVWLGREAPP